MRKRMLRRVKCMFLAIALTMSTIAYNITPVYASITGDESEFELIITDESGSDDLVNDVPTKDDSILLDVNDPVDVLSENLIEAYDTESLPISNDVDVDDTNYNLEYSDNVRAWSEADRLPEEAGSYKLMNDVKLSNCWVANADITLDLNGHTITRSFPTDTDYGFVVSVDKEVTLTLVNSNTGKNGIITGGIEKYRNGTMGGGVYVHGNFIMDKGVEISGNKGSAVYVGSDASFVMNGGKISNNTAEWGSGAAVTVHGKFTMTDGDISENTGIYKDDGALTSSVSVEGIFTMEGGNITDNVGCGVYVYHSTFVMTGGKISGNTCKNGGGISAFNGTITMSGNAKISENTATAGAGIYASRCKFSMSGNAIIEGNTASYGGGLVLVNEADGSITGNASITGNNPCGVDVSNKSTFNMTGGKITDNTGYGTFVENTCVCDMTGGLICGNNGSGVHVRGVFKMSDDARIIGNTGNFGAVAIYSDGKFIMTGGEISDNTISSGAGVDVLGEFIMSDDAKIANNIGHGVSVRDNGTFTMTGGKIIGNTTEEDGGGVFAKYGSKFDMSGGAITGNKTTKGTGGGIYARNEAKVTIAGGSIIGNSSASGVGGVICNADAELIISGNPVIRDNHTGGTKSSDGLYRNGESTDLAVFSKEVTVTGALTDGAEIYIYGKAGDLIAQGRGYILNASDADKFIADSNEDGKEYFCDLAAGKLYLKAKFANTGIAKSVSYGVTGGVDLSEFYQDGVTVGDISISDESSILKPGTILTDKTLTFEVKNERDLIGKIAVISIPVSGGTRYEDCTVNITVTVVPNNCTLVIGQKLSIKETCFPNVSETIANYTIDDKKLAGVSKGVLSGKKPGTVKVTAQNQTGETLEECTVTILNKPKLKFTKSMTYVGQTVNANDFFMTEDIRSFGATYLESAKSDVVEVVDSKAGTLKAKGSGTAKITAYFGDKDKAGTVKVSASIAVKVPSFAKSEYTMQTGAKLTLTMKNVNAVSNPDWASERSGIIRVTPQTDKKGNKTGKVILEGLACGDTKLYATIDGQEYECTVHISEPVINKKEMVLKVGKTGTLSLKQTKLKKSNIEWTSKNPSIAEVDSAGKVKAKSVGTTVIYTEAGGIRNECTVTVK